MKLYFKYQNISPYYIYKGSCAVIWDRLDYLSESEKQLGDKNIRMPLSMTKYFVIW